MLNSLSSLRLLHHIKTTNCSFIMAARRSSRITALKDKPASTPTISQHFKPSKPTTKRKAGKISETNKDDNTFDTPKPNGGVSSEVQEPVSSKRKTSKITGDNFLVDHLPNGAAIVPTPKKQTTRRPGLVAANTAPRQVTQLAHTVHPLETLSAIPPPAEDRLVDPYQANAPLIVPSSQPAEVVARTPVPDALPFLDESKEVKEEHGEEVLTTGNVLQKALDHLVAVEPKLKPIIEKHHCGVFNVNGLKEVIDPWVSLTSSIIGQQVSGAAAKSIKNKFVALFNPDSTDNAQMVFPTPSKVAETPIETLRTAGLSQRKAEYIQGLAQKFASGELTTEFLMKAPYEEVFEKLVSVRGLGAWSVEMFACFGLKRLDVFSTGDLGVQ